MKRILLFALPLLAIIAVALSFILASRNHTADIVQVGHLASRDHVITIFTDGNRNFFTVASRSGKESSGLLDESGLRSKFPDLHRQLKTGIAGGDDYPVWAGSEGHERPLPEIPIPASPVAIETVR